jgi:hypothetical protein
VTSPISEEPQPDPKPSASETASPSLWLYFGLLLAAVSLTWIAFSKQQVPDWPGLLVNLAAGLVGSVVVLVVIDRRLRASELAALRSLPTRTTRGLAWLVFPTKRTGLRYVQRLLVALEPLVSGKVELASFAQLEDKVRAGFVLTSGEGLGKTTWTQFVAVSIGRKYLDADPNGRIPILFRVASWLPDRTLHEALFETFASFTPCRRKRFNRILESGNVVVLIDGYDELWKRQLPFHEDVQRLRSQFPSVRLTVTSRSDKPTPTEFGETVSLDRPTAEELDVIGRRRRR